MRRLLALLLLASIAAVIAACGGDDGSSGSGDILTQEEWVAAADTICADAEAQLDDQLDDLGTPGTSEETLEEALEKALDFLDDAGVIQRQEIADLRALGTPPDIQEQVDRAYSLLEQQLNIIKEAGDLLQDGDVLGMQELLDSIEPIQAEADEIALNLGLTECGGDDS